jgi:hypothetical protein
VVRGYKGSGRFSTTHAVGRRLVFFLIPAVVIAILVEMLNPYDAGRSKPLTPSCPPSY